MRGVPRELLVGTGIGVGLGAIFRASLIAAIAAAAWNRSAAWLVIALALEACALALRVLTAFEQGVEAARTACCGVGIPPLLNAKVLGTPSNLTVVLRRRDDDLLLACGHRINLAAVEPELAEILAGEERVFCGECASEGEEIVDADYVEKEEP